MGAIPGGHGFHRSDGPQSLRVNPHDQMTVGGLRIQLQLLLARQVPVDVKPVGIARGEEKFFGPVGLGQLGFRRWKILQGRRRAEGKFFAGAAGGRRFGGITFEQDRRNLAFFAAGVGAADEGFGGNFGFGVGRFGGGRGLKIFRAVPATVSTRVFGVRLGLGGALGDSGEEIIFPAVIERGGLKFFPGWHGCWFRFHNRDSLLFPCYLMRLTSPGCKVTWMTRRMQREFSSKRACHRFFVGVYCNYPA